MFKILISVITVLAFASSINARPAASAALVGEDLPWQIYNLSINALPVNTTKANETQHITFAAVDNNVNLTFTTTCSRLVPAGQSLFSDGYTRCEFADAGFSLRQDGRLFFHRRFRNKYVMGVSKTMVW